MEDNIERVESVPESRWVPIREFSPLECLEKPPLVNVLFHLSEFLINRLLEILIVETFNRSRTFSTNAIKNFSTASFCGTVLRRDGERPKSDENRAANDD